MGREVMDGYTSRVAPIWRGCVQSVSPVQCSGNEVGLWGAQARRYMGLSSARQQTGNVAAWPVVISAFSLMVVTVCICMYVK